MYRRVLAAGATIAIASAGLALSAPTTAGAQEYLGDTVSGNFIGGPADEMFDYWAGTEQDWFMWFEDDDSDPTTPPMIGYEPNTVNGNYFPVVGNFDGDEWDEILWYAPGTATDYVWSFTSPIAHTSTPYTVNGNYWPVVGDYTGDGTDDILWYVAGRGQDYVWDYAANGTYVSTKRSINGSFYPVSGSFGKNNTDDIFWYAPGTAKDYLWDYNVGNVNYVSTEQPVNGYYSPFALDLDGEGWRGEDIFWFAGEPGSDSVWDYAAGVKSTRPYQVPFNDYPVPGDYFGDGHDDIFWYNQVLLWDHALDGNRYDWSWALSAALDASGGTGERSSRGLDLPALPAAGR